MPARHAQHRARGRRPGRGWFHRPAAGSAPSDGDKIAAANTPRRDDDPCDEISHMQ